MRGAMLIKVVCPSLRQIMNSFCIAVACRPFAALPVNPRLTPGMLFRSRPFRVSLGLPGFAGGLGVRNTVSVNSLAHSSRGCLPPGAVRMPPGRYP